MSPVSRTTSEPSPLPQEFSHRALQALVRKGRTTGHVTGEQVAEALRTAEVRPARGRVVLRALADQGITVSTDGEASGVAAAATRTAKKSAATARTGRPPTKPPPNGPAPPAEAAKAAAGTSPAPTTKTATKKATAKKATAKPKGAAGDEAPAEESTDEVVDLAVDAAAEDEAEDGPRDDADAEDGAHPRRRRRG